MRQEIWQDLYNSENKDEPPDPRRYLWLVSLAATRADQLGIVEAYGNRVRFPHSILQAYLGCRFLDSLLQETDENKALDKVLEEPGPGRELLIALCLYSRAQVCQCASKANGDHGQTRASEPAPPVSPAPVTAEVVLSTAAEAAAPGRPGHRRQPRPRHVPHETAPVTPAGPKRPPPHPHDRGRRPRRNGPGRAGHRPRWRLAVRPAEAGRC